VEKVEMIHHETKTGKNNLADRSAGFSTYCNVILCFAANYLQIMIDKPEFSIIQFST